MPQRPIRGLRGEVLLCTVPCAERRVLKEEVASRLGEMLQGVAEEHGRKMSPLAIKCNRAHFSVQANARHASRQFIYRFEGTSAHVLFSEFDHMHRLSSLKNHLFRTISSGPSLPRRHDRGGGQAGNKQHIEDQSQMNFRQEEGVAEHVGSPSSRSERGTKPVL